MESPMFQYNEVKNPIAKYLLWSGIIIVLLAPFVLFALISNALDFNTNTPHPSDNELIQNFQSNEEDFNKLVNMSNVDAKVERIAFDFTHVTGENQSGEMGKDRPVGFSEDRWNEYRAIFNKLKLKSGISRESDSKGTIIYLTSFSKGMSFSRTRSRI
jgi:hypothetical protein